MNIMSIGIVTPILIQTSADVVDELSGCCIIKVCYTVYQCMRDLYISIIRDVYTVAERVTHHRYNIYSVYCAHVTLTGCHVHHDQHHFSNTKHTAAAASCNQFTKETSKC